MSEPKCGYCRGETLGPCKCGPGSQYNKEYYDSGKTWYNGLELYGDGPGCLRDCIGNVMQLKHFFPTAKYIIDIGAGKGFFVLAARMAGLNAIGYEISEYAMNEAPDDVGPYLLQYDGKTIDLCGAPRPDVITSWFVHEHIPEADMKEQLVQLEALAIQGVLLRLPIVPPYMTVEEYRKTDKDPTHCNTQKLEYWLEVVPSVTDLVFSSCWYTNNKAGGSRATIVFKKKDYWEQDKEPRDPFFQTF